MTASATPAALANSLVVVPLKPFARKEIQRGFEQLLLAIGGRHAGGRKGDLVHGDEYK